MYHRGTRRIQNAFVIIILITLLLPQLLVGACDPRMSWKRTQKADPGDPRMCWKRTQKAETGEDFPTAPVGSRSRDLSIMSLAS